MHWVGLQRAIGSSGASAAFVYTISSNTKNAFVDSTELTNSGWDGSGPVTIVVDSGVYCWSDNSNPGLEVDVPGATLTIQVDGYVIGSGGDGGNALNYSGGGDGGDALHVSQSCTITGAGYIGGAGYSDVAYLSGGDGGDGGSSGGNGSTSSEYDLLAAGGGGGGWGASGGDGFVTIDYLSYPFTAGGNGGKAVEPNGNTVTWNWTGTYYGAVT